MNCPKCSSSYYFLSEHNSEFCKCRKCGHIGKFIQPRYDNYYKERYNYKLVRDRNNDPMLALICDSLPFNENDAVLDYGCGAGDYTFYISSRCKKIIGLDISVVKAKTRFKNIDFRRQDSDKKIELDSNSVDKIICINVIEHAKEYKKLLKDLKRVLKPGGWLFITTFDREFVLHNLHNDSTHVFEWNKKEFEEFISVEFDIVKSIKYGSFFNYYPLNKLITKVLKPELCLVATKRF